MNDIEAEKRFKALQKQFAKHKAEYDKGKSVNPNVVFKIIADMPKYKHKPYMCSKCGIFHKYKYKGQPSKTHKSHFKHFVKYKENYSESELWKLGFKKNWKRESEYIKDKKGVYA